MLFFSWCFGGFFFLVPLVPILELCPLAWYIVFLPTGGYPQNQQFCSVKT